MSDGAVPQRDVLRRVGSACWLKTALANREISLMRFNSAFFLRSRLSSSASLLVNRSSRDARGQPSLGADTCGTSR
jgi:hypothetical protein